MNTKRMIFEHLATNCEVYLPMYQLEKLYLEIKERIQTEHLFHVLDEIEACETYKKYNDPDQGAYRLTNEHVTYCQKISKPIEQLELITGLVVAEFNSLYAAAKKFHKEGDVKSTASNISRATRKGCSAYGFNWKYKTQ